LEEKVAFSLCLTENECHL